MKIINWWINNVTIGGFLIVSVVSGIFCLVLTGSLVFGYNPYYISQSGNITLGFTDFKKGIPVTLDFDNGFVNGDIQDIGNDSIISRNTTRLVYEVTAKSELDNQEVGINKMEIFGGLKLTSGTIHIKPDSLRSRGILILPLILLLLISSFCLWQLGMFLHYIQSGESFDLSNYKRIKNIGLGLLVYNFLLWGLDMLFPHFSVVTNFESTAPGFRSPVVLAGQPALEYGLNWFLAGCLFLILASAFKKGHQLQKEQDLTI